MNSEAEIHSGDNPGFQDVAKNLFFLTAKSACLNKAGPLPAAVQNNFPVVQQFKGPRGIEKRPAASLKDLGALERVSEE